MNRKPSPWLVIYAAAMAAAAACGGTDGETATATRETPGIVPPVTSMPSAAATPSPDLDPRTDGLAGAPVPPPEPVSVSVDLSRSNNAGDFPPLTDPAAVPAADATWLDGDSLVLGAVQNGEARAYQLSMMTFHHVVNDSLGGDPYLVTF
ncbi:MAG: DUF3179 domain-containing (seleno)protein [Dehalococcoidia bacterium]